MDQALAAHEPYRTISERYGTSPPALHRHQQRHAQPPGAVLLGAPPSQAAPPGGWPALGDTAHRVHAAACQTRDLTRNLRSTHEPALLERLEGLANLLVEVTSLLVALTTKSL
jgi:hypothetical protein